MYLSIQFQVRAPYFPHHPELSVTYLLEIDCVTKVIQCMTLQVFNSGDLFHVINKIKIQFCSGVPANAMDS